MTKTFVVSCNVGLSVGKGWYRALAIGVRFYKDPNTGRTRIQGVVHQEALDPSRSANLAAELSIKAKLYNAPLRPEDLEKSIEGKTSVALGMLGRTTIPGGSYNFAEIGLNFLHIGLGALTAALTYHGHPVLATISGFMTTSTMIIPSMMNTNILISSFGYQRSNLCGRVLAN